MDETWPLPRGESPKPPDHAHTVPPAQTPSEASNIPRRCALITSNMVPRRVTGHLLNRSSFDADTTL